MEEWPRQKDKAEGSLGKIRHPLFYNCNWDFALLVGLEVFWNVLFR
jgi:hypothetical protein